jgi:hypothetical protein
VVLMPLLIEITAAAQTALQLDPKLVRAVLRSAGAEIAAVARRKVRTAVGSGRLAYSATKGKHRALLLGQPPGELVS